jgi:hypothetical protein
MVAEEIGAAEFVEAGPQDTDIHSGPGAGNILSCEAENICAYCVAGYVAWACGCIAGEIPQNLSVKQQGSGFILLFFKLLLDVAPEVGPALAVLHNDIFCMLCANHLCTN